MTEFVPKFNLKSVKNDRDLRKIRLKLDCPSEIEWDRWKPGREHQKTFHVKNILNKVQVQSIELHLKSRIQCRPKICVKDDAIFQ